MMRDRHGREVLIDVRGLRYVVDDGVPFYVTSCCDASVTGSMGEIVCRACYGAVDAFLGGLPVIVVESPDEPSKRLNGGWT